MIKRLYFLFFLSIITTAINNITAQVEFNTAIDRQIDANYSQHISDVELTFDGGYVSVAGNRAFSLSKFSRTGGLQWSTDLSWGTGIYYARYVAQLKDSGYAVTGVGGSDPNSWEVGFTRLDKNGNVLWIKTLNGVYTPYEFDMGSWIAQSLDGGLIIGGQNNGKAVMIKTDINGTVQWSRTYPELPWIKSGFLDADTGYTVWGVNTNNPGYVEKMKVDKNGNVVSGKSYNFLSNDLSVKRTRDKGYIVLVEQYGTIPILMKTDSNGSVQWTKKYVLAAQGRRFQDVVEVNDGYVFTGESFYSPANNGCTSGFWTKTDTAGNLLWLREYGSKCTTVPYAIKQTPDKGFVIWASIYIVGTSTQYSALIKTDSLGSTVCPLYTETLTQSSMSMTGTTFTITSSAITGFTDRTNTYAGAAVNVVTPCSAFPVAQFSGDNLNICAGSAVNFTDQSTGGPSSWRWTFNGGSPDTSVSQNPSITYSTPGTYDVVLSVTNSDGADSIRKSGYITVSASQAITLSSGDTFICAGNSVLLIATGGNNYIWNPSLGLNTTTGDTVVASPTDSTTYFVTSNGSTCTDTATVTVIVNPVPVVPVLSTNDSLICASDSARIDAAGSYSSYLWNNGDTSNYTYVNAAGGYWVTVTNVRGCSAISSHLNIAVYPAPSVSIVVQGDTLSSYGAVSYQWYLEDSAIAGATSAYYIAVQSGNYSVQIVDTNGCSARSNPTYILITGIADMSNSSIPVYPNPTSGKVYISSADGIKLAGIRIFNVVGQEVSDRISFETTGNKIVMDIQNLPVGVYQLQIADDKKYSTVKLLKN